MSTENSVVHDLEKGSNDHAHLTNDVIRTFGWEGITVTVKDRTTKQPKSILSGVNGMVKAGEMLALMGPSGSGKTTLLNVLAHRQATQRATVKKSLFINGCKTSLKDFRKISSYVEQEDALLGALTVRETMYFAAKLALPSSISKLERLERIEALLAAFGLTRQANTIVGTPIRKGISGGQKRRVSVASQLITSPKILFLDEPTSGLDSAASFEVMNFVKQIAKKYKLLVVASIHQPSTTTFELFDKLLLLSHGRTIYNGAIGEVQHYFDSLGHRMPVYMNPAEFIIDLVNTDFAQDQDKADNELNVLQDSWVGSSKAASIIREIEEETSGPKCDLENGHMGANKFLLPFTLIHRSLIKSYRDVIAYGIRVAMYLGLAVMMGTVWLRLGLTQDNIQNFINAIFFGGAFMSFMAVAYIPAYIEDMNLYLKERANGLYGPTSFLVANFITGLPFLFIITVLFSVVAYWLSNFQPTAEAFFTWIMWLFLDLLAAESLVVFISSVFPIFVVALAATAFANGLWMSVGGFMVLPDTLNPFWRYVFHYIDYQAYVFQGMMVNEFRDRGYYCANYNAGPGKCQCMYTPMENDQCMISGRRVLEAYGYGTDSNGKWVGILLAIIFGYRLLGWLAMYLRKH